MYVISLFSGCGGLDLGFEQAGFRVVFANDIDKSLNKTYELNHGLKLDNRSIEDLKGEELPKADGIIGGPPCQSWSLAGKMLGAKDKRGMLFFEYVRVIREKQPKFFVAENVPGIVSSAHIAEFKKLLGLFEEAGYAISYKVLDARDYGVPQERKRVIIVGYRKDLSIRFQFPQPTHSKQGGKAIDGKQMQRYLTLNEAIGDLPEAVPAIEKNRHVESLPFPNQEYMTGSFSTIYMSRNRLKKWGDCSYTIQAGGRHAPLHPSSASMCKVSADKWIFAGESPKYRRLSVREAARIQTFPDDFIFVYKSLADGYKMVGNAVPVKLAYVIAKKILEDLAAVAKTQVKISRQKVKALVSKEPPSQNLTSLL
jgi:DNA (cytosine-5)-methyltransferase 1